MKKVAAIVLVILVCGGLIFGFLQGRKEQEAERQGEKPGASRSEVNIAKSGEPILTLDPESQTRMGLKVAVLQAAQVEPEFKAYGHVLDPLPLISLVMDYYSAKALAKASESELVRLRKLAGQDNVAQKVLQAAEATAEHDRLAEEALRLRLLSGWGKTITEKEDLQKFSESLAAGTIEFVRLDLLPGESLKSTPTRGRLTTLGDEAHSVSAEVVGSATTTDPQMQGQGFILQLNAREPGFAPGAAVIGFLQIQGEPLQGVVVPGESITRLNGSTFVYVQDTERTFVRRECSTTKSIGGDWFVSSGFRAGERVVTQGARLLLSEEQKGQIRMGD